MKTYFCKLALIVPFCLCVVQLQAQTIFSGKVDDVTWTFDETTGVLDFQGTGGIPNMDYQGVSQPWISFRDKIKHVSVGEGITEIKYYTLSFIQMQSISLPQTLTSIGFTGIYKCYSLKSIILPPNLTYLGPVMLGRDTALTAIVNLCKEPQIMQWGNGYYTFEDLDLKKINLFVPGESIEKYKVAEGWKDFGRIGSADNTYLTHLLSSVRYQPSFNKDILTYTAVVPLPYDSTEVSLTPFTEEDYSKAVVGNTQLKVGENVIPVTVTAVDGVSEREYNLVVRRKNNDARLKSITSTQGTFMAGFNRDRYEHTLLLPSKSVYVVIDGITFDPNATFIGNIEVYKPTTGNTEVATLHVTAEDTAYYKDYKVICKWKSDNNLLSKLEVSGYDIYPTFQPYIYNYSVDVPSHTTGITVKADAMDSLAWVSGDNYQHLYGNVQKLKVTVKPEDGVDGEYIITVNRRQATGHLTPVSERCVYRRDGQIHINTNTKERISVYKTTGVKIYDVEKGYGEISLPDNHVNDILIIRGNSGWVEKKYIYK